MMNAQEKRLTEAQSEFAERHHHVVLDFLRRRKLPMSEFYDVIVFRYLKTVQLYCSSPRLRKYRFEVIANKAMDWAVKDYWRNTYKKALRTISLDSISPEGLSRHELTAADDPGLCDAVCDTLSVDALLSALDNTQHTILSLRLDGYKDFEIAKRLNIPIREVTSAFSDMQAAVMAMGAKAYA